MCIFCDLAEEFGQSGGYSHFCLSRCVRVDTWWADHWAGALVVSGFVAECTLCVALVLANNGGLLEDVHTSGEAFQSLGDLLSRVEGLGFLEDVLASSQTLQRLADLLGDLLGRSASGVGDAVGDAHR